MKRNIRVIFLIAFSVIVLGVLVLKASTQGWFVIHPPLELNGQPTLLFFTLSDGCDCQMKVIRKAATQIEFWEPTEQMQIAILRIDFDERPDLAECYDVHRAPALVLLDSNGKEVWMQDEPKSDDKPFDMAEVEEQITTLVAMDGR